MKHFPLMLICLLCLLVAACGGSQGEKNPNKPANGSGQGYGDHHDGAKTALGDIDLGDGVKAVVVQVGKAEAGKEFVAEVKLTRDDKDLTGAELEGYVGDVAGKELSAPDPGQWMSDKHVYDIHGEVPRTPPAEVHFWVRIRLNEKERRGSVRIKIE